jgi:hypothetical protein
MSDTTAELQTEVSMLREQLEDALKRIQQSPVAKQIVGLRGPRGADGKTVVGPRGVPGKDSTVPGPPGKDADTAEIVKQAERFVQSGLVQIQNLIPQLIVQELKRAGTVDEHGKAILLPGPKGDRGEQGIPGKDSMIAGPQGKPGVGIPGPQGKPGVPGRDSNVPGPKGDKGDRGEQGESVQGPQGVQGIQGSPGIRRPAGDISACLHNVEQMLKEFRVKILHELGLEAK